MAQGMRNHPPRTLEQNALMWALLGDIAEQKQHMGQRYSPDQWKVLFLHALGQQVQFLPALDGSGWVPYGHQRSSTLSKKQFTDLIETIVSWGISNGVQFRHLGDNAA